MIKNLEDAVRRVADSNYDVERYTIEGNSIDMEFKSRSGNTTWHGYIDFNDDGTFSTTNFMNSTTPSYIATEISKLLEVV